MNNKPIQQTWEHYVQAWNAASNDERFQHFQRALTPDAIYTDPLTLTINLNELSEYMSQFHEQFPGYFFETQHFLSHHQHSIARWEMKDSHGQTISKGISHGRYNDQGFLISATGFYDTPENT